MKTRIDLGRSPEDKGAGFTLIELLIVIAIIGILAGTILVSVNAARQKGVNARVQGEVIQIRTQLEQSLLNNAYADISGNAGNVDSLISTSSDYANLTTLLCDIGKENGYPTTVPNDISLTCEGLPEHTGIVIYSNASGWNVSDYGVYSTTTPGGYVCADSYGNSVVAPTSTIPDYGSITSTSTAICQ